MWSGTTSWGSATSPRGKRGKSRRRSPMGRWYGPGRAGDDDRGLRALARRDHQVVEHGRREARLEQHAVDVLEADVAPEGVHLPRPRHRVRIGRRLEGAVGPAEPVGQQLLAAHADVGEAGGARAALELV